MKKKLLFNSSLLFLASLPVLSVFSCSTSQTKETPNKDEKFYLNPIIRRRIFWKCNKKNAKFIFLKSKRIN